MTGYKIIITVVERGQHVLTNDKPEVIKLEQTYATIEESMAAFETVKKSLK